MHFLYTKENSKDHVQMAACPMVFIPLPCSIAPGGRLNAHEEDPRATLLFLVESIPADLAMLA